MKKQWPVSSDKMSHGMYWEQGVTWVGGCKNVSPGCLNC